MAGPAAGPRRLSAHGPFQIPPWQCRLLRWRLVAVTGSSSRAESVAPKTRNPVKGSLIQSLEWASMLAKRMAPTKTSSLAVRGHAGRKEGHQRPYGQDLVLQDQGCCGGLPHKEKFSTGDWSKCGKPRTGSLKFHLGSADRGCRILFCTNAGGLKASGALSRTESKRGASSTK